MFFPRRHPSDWHWKVSRSRGAPPCTAQTIFHSTVTWVGGNKAYVKTKTSYETSNKVVSGLGSVFTCYFVCWAIGPIASHIWRGQLERQVFSQFSNQIFELNHCVKHRHSVHRPSYHRSKLSHPEPTNCCCWSIGQLPSTLVLSSNYCFFQTLVRPRWFQWYRRYSCVSYVVHLKKVLFINCFLVALA